MLKYFQFIRDLFRSFTAKLAVLPNGPATTLSTPEHRVAAGIKAKEARFVVRSLIFFPAKPVY
jgi:hypothetical protein